MTKDKTKKTKGHLWWKKWWASICSMHGLEGPQVECNMCQSGTWVNVWGNKTSGIIHYMFPVLWIWWMNRPNSKARKQVKKWFPKLK